MHLGKPLCSLLFCLYPKRNWSGGRGREGGRDRGKARDETGRDRSGKVNLRDQRPTDNGIFLFCCLSPKIFGQISCSCLIFRMRRGRGGCKKFIRPHAYA